MGHGEETFKASGKCVQSFIESIERQLDEVPEDDEHLQRSMEAQLINLVSKHLSGKARRRLQKNFQLKHGVACPAMPLRSPVVPEHRGLVTRHVFPAMVARPVPKNEMMAKEAARKAMRSEWKRLWDKKVWAHTDVREWSEVARLARKGGENIHMARIFGICVE